MHLLSPSAGMCAIVAMMLLLLSATLSLPSAGLLYAGSLWLSNASYLYLSVSFIQMTKSLMPGLVYATGCFVGTEKYKAEVAVIMSLIAFGVVVCAIGEVNLMVVGVVVQLASLAFEVGVDMTGAAAGMCSWRAVQVGGEGRGCGYTHATMSTSSCTTSTGLPSAQSFCFEQAP